MTREVDGGGDLRCAGGARAKDKVEEAKISLEEMLREGRIGPETATKVKVSLDETRVFLDNFR